MAPLYHRKANGKLLLTGEYFVLDGAPSIALTLSFGQTLTVVPSDHFQWRCYDMEGQCWFDFESVSMNKEKQLIEELIEKIGLNTKASYRFTIDFDRRWGLGTSSTFLGLISDFTNSNPYELNQYFFKGSGYDIACCFEHQPIIYQVDPNLEIPKVTQTIIPDHIKNCLYFIYTGQKQNSKQAIENYRLRDIDQDQIRQSIEDINAQLLAPSTSSDLWIEQLTEHENLISASLNIPKISETLMKDIPYFTKSLGAWGGDFVMCVTEQNEDQVKKTFESKGFKTFFNFNELILG
jgi:mevalonate kinase